MSRITFEDQAPTARSPKRISPKKLAANRKNSKKSTGPRTPKGKKTVSQNARKHGCSQSALLPGECDATYEIHLNEMQDDLRPSTPMQYHLVSQISQIIWKLHRMADAEKELFALNSQIADAPCQTLARSFHQNPTSNDFALFERYQRQLRTSWLRLHTHLRQLKKDPPPTYDESEPRTLVEARRRIQDAFPSDAHVNLMARISPEHSPEPDPAPQTTNHTQQTTPEIKPTESPKNPISKPASLPTHEIFNQTKPTPPPPP